MSSAIQVNQGDQYQVYQVFLGKLNIRATALAQLHQLRLTAHVLEAPNAALHSLLTSQKNRQKRF